MFEDFKQIFTGENPSNLQYQHLGVELFYSGVVLNLILKLTMTFSLFFEYT